MGTIAPSNCKRIFNEPSNGEFCHRNAACLLGSAFLANDIGSAKHRIEPGCMLKAINIFLHCAL